MFSTRTYANLSVENYFNARGLTRESRLMKKITYAVCSESRGNGCSKLKYWTGSVIDLNLSSFESQTLTRPQDILLILCWIYGVNLVNGRVNLLILTDLFRMQVLRLQFFLIWIYASLVCL